MKRGVHRLMSLVVTAAVGVVCVSCGGTAPRNQGVDNRWYSGPVR